MTYAYHDGTIIFRTSPYGVLSELVRPTDVALEIDELDQESRQVWSVVVQGRAQGIAEPDQLVRMWAVGGVVPGPRVSGTCSSGSFRTVMLAALVHAENDNPA